MKPKPHPDQRPVTDWIPGDQKPIRPGMYQRKLPTGIYWARWDAGLWRYAFTSQDLARRIRNPSKYQTRYPWRGCLNPPIIDTPATKKG